MLESNAYIRMVSEALWSIQFLDPDKQTLAIIGAGKIGTAILRALKDEWNVIGTGRSDETIERVRRIGAIATKDNAMACRMADVIILSVKPSHLKDLLTLSRYLEGKLVISVLAGVRTSILESEFPKARVVRAMPNINAIIGESVTAISAGRSARESDVELAERIFRKLGDVFIVPEEYMDPITALIGSGPALVSEIIDAMLLGAVAAGMPRELAYRMLLRLIEGTVRVLEETGMHPAQLRDLVTTPGGTTITGISIMEEMRVKSGIIYAIKGASDRAKEIGAHMERVSVIH